MIKKDLVAAMAVEMETTKVEAEKALNAFLKVVEETLAKGESIQLVGFGTFEVVERAARNGHNPQTNEQITIPASKVPKFRPGKALKDKINA